MKLNLLLILVLAIFAACSKSIHYDKRKVPLVVCAAGSSFFGSSCVTNPPADEPFSFFTVEKNVISPITPVQTNDVFFFARDNTNYPITGLTPNLTITPATGPVQTCSMVETSTLGTYLCTVSIGENYNVSITPGSILFMTDRDVADVVVTDTPYCYTNSGLAWTNHKQVGSGTLADPHLICSAAQLKSLSMAPADLGLAYKQMIDLELATFLATLANEFSIGDSSTPFTGSYDGNTLSVENYHSTALGGSFFGQVGAGEIKNLDLTFTHNPLNGSVVGGLINSIVTTANVSLSNVSVDGTINCPASCIVGGMVGQAQITGVGQLTTSQLTSKVTVNNAAVVGGVIAIANAPSASRIIMNETSSSLTVNGATVPTIGGVVGEATGVTLTDVRVDLSANISNTSNFIGGAVGVSNSFLGENILALGDVLVNGIVVGVGGIIGQAQSGTVLEDSVALVNLTGGDCTECGKVVGQQLAVISVPNLFTSNQTLFQFDSISNGQNVVETEINTIVQPDYFYNSANAPFNVWDFTNVWQSFPINVPELRFTQP